MHLINRHKIQDEKEIRHLLDDAEANFGGLRHEIIDQEDENYASDLPGLSDLDETNKISCEDIGDKTTNSSGAQSEDASFRKSTEWTEEWNKMRSAFVKAQVWTEDFRDWFAGFMSTWWSTEEKRQDLSEEWIKDTSCEERITSNEKVEAKPKLSPEERRKQTSERLVAWWSSISEAERQAAVERARKLCNWLWHGEGSEERRAALSERTKARWSSMPEAELQAWVKRGRNLCN